MPVYGLERVIITHWQAGSQIHGASHGNRYTSAECCRGSLSEAAAAAAVAFRVRLGRPKATLRAEPDAVSRLAALLAMLFSVTPTGSGRQGPTSESDSPAPVTARPG